MKTFFALLLILSCASYAHAGDDNNKKSVRLTPTNLGEQIYKSGEKARLLLDFSGVKVTEESGLKDFDVSPSDYEFHAFFPDGMSEVTEDLSFSGVSTTKKGKAKKSKGPIGIEYSSAVLDANQSNVFTLVVGKVSNRSRKLLRIQAKFQKRLLKITRKISKAKKQKRIDALNEIKSELEHTVTAIEKALAKDSGIISKISLPLQINNATAGNMEYMASFNGHMLSLSSVTGRLFEGQKADVSFGVKNNRIKQNKGKWTQRFDTSFGASLDSSNIGKLEAGQSFTSSLSLNSVSSGEVPASSSLYRIDEEREAELWGSISLPLIAEQDNVVPVFDAEFTPSPEIEVAPSFPLISGIVRDTQGRIDPDSIKILVDGVERSNLLTLVSLLDGAAYSFEADINPVDEGTHSIEILASDTAGNLAVPISRTLIIDRTPPALAVEPDVELFQKIRDHSILLSIEDVSQVTIEIKNNGIVVGSDQASGVNYQKAFSFTLDENANQIVVVVTDKAGLVTEKSLGVVTVDSIPPVLSNIKPLGDSFFNTRSIQVSGDANEALQSVTGNEQSLSLDDLKKSFSGFINYVEDGSFSVQIKASDLAGNETLETTSFTIDTVAPIVALNIDDGHLSKDSSFSLNLSIDELNLSSASLKLNGLSVPVSLVNQQTVAMTLQEGVNLIEVQVIDLAGNQTTKVVNNIVLDSIPPELALSTPDEGQFFNQSSVPVSGTSSETLKEASVNGSALSLSGDKLSFSGSLTLSEGDHSISLSGSDLAGNQTSLSRSIVVDLTAPVLGLGQADNQLLNEETFILPVQVDDAHFKNFEVFLNGSKLHHSDLASADVSLTLAFGKNVIKVVANDLAGNSASKELQNIELDNKAPVLSISSPLNGEKSSTSSFDIIGSSDEKIVEASVNGIQLIVSADGLSFSGSVSDLAEGSNTLNVKALDLAGNEGNASVSVLVDTQAPMISLSKADPIKTNNSSLSLDINVSDLSATSTELFLNGSKVFESSLLGFSHTFELIEGSNAIRIVSTDEFGNSSEAALNDITLDSQGPVIADLQPLDGATLNSLTVSVSGSSNEKLSTASVNGISLGLSADGLSFSGSVVFETEGAQTLNFSFVDELGNTTSVVRNIIIALPVENVAPVAEFAFTPSENIEVGMEVSFDSSASTDSDGQIVNYLWELSTGESFNNSIPTGTYIFTQAGSYQIKLTVTDNDGLSASLSKTLVVVEPPKPPVAVLEASPLSGNIPLEVSFDASASNDLDGDIVSYQFDFGDGENLNSTNPLVTHTYNAEGEFLASVRVVDSVGNESTVSVTINATVAKVAPVADFAFTPEAGIEVGIEVSFDGLPSTDSDGQIVNYFWEISNGATHSSVDPTVDYVFSVAQTFQVSLTVTDNDGLTDKITKDIVVLSPPPAPVASLAVSAESGNVPLEVIFDASGSSGTIVSYNYDFKDGSNLVTDQAQVSHNFQNAGIFDVSMTVIDDRGRQDTANVTITVTDPNQVPSDAVPYFTYNWDPDNGQLSFEYRATGDVQSAKYIVDGTEYPINEPLFRLQTDAGEHFPGETMNVILEVTDTTGNSSRLERNLDFSILTSLQPVSVFKVVQSAPNTVFIDLRDSFSPTYDYNEISFKVDMGDGTIIEKGFTKQVDETLDKFITHSYAGPGVKNIEVTVYDKISRVGISSQQFEVSGVDLGIVSPVADFYFTVPDFANSVSFFRDESGTPNGEIISTHWDFGDGITGTGDEIVHFYEPGSYLVKMTVTDTAGERSSTQRRVNVFGSEGAFTSWVNCIPTGLAINCLAILLDKQGELVSFDVDFGDGNILEGLPVNDVTWHKQDGDHQYDLPGTYTVTISSNTLRGESAQDQMEITVDYSQPSYPGLVFTCNQTSNVDVQCDAAGSFDTDGLITDINWDMGDGTILSGFQISYTYAETNDYFIDIRVTDDDGLQRFGYFFFQGDDLKAPRLALFHPENGLVTREGLVIFRGSYDEPLSEFTINSELVEVDESRAFRYIAELSEGINNFELNAVDLVLNSSLETIKITKDSVDPIIQLTNLPTSPTNHGNFLFDYTIIDDNFESVKVNRNGVQISNLLASQGTVNGTLEIGDNIIEVIAIDKAGNTKTEEIANIQYVAADVTPPKLVQLFPSFNSFVNSQNITVTATFNEALSSGAMNGVAGAIGADLKTISATVALIGTGSQSLNIIASDLEGNTVSTASTVIVDVLNPQINSDLSSNMTLSSTDLVFSVDVIEEYYDKTEIILNGSIVNQKFQKSTQVYLELPEGDNTIVIKAYDKAGNVGSIMYSNILVPVGTKGVTDNARTLASGENYTFEDKYSFIYEGENPLQIGLSQETLDKEKTSVITGKILNQRGFPVQGAEIRLRDRDQYGVTYSKQNGTFFMAVNGGETYTLDISKSESLSTVKYTNTIRNEFKNIGEVTLTKLSSESRSVDFSSSSSDLIELNSESGVLGTRTPSVFMESGTVATIINSDGTQSTQSLLNLSFTEISVNDPQKLSGMTETKQDTLYAFDLSISQSLDSGISKVEFSKPLAFYIENTFSPLGPGSLLDIEYYDESEKYYRQDGEAALLLKIVDIVNEKAVLSINPNGEPLTDTHSLALGIDDDELIRISQKYPIGTELWRQRLNHLTRYRLVTVSACNGHFYGGANVFEGESPDGCTIVGSKKAENYSQCSHVYLRCGKPGTNDQQPIVRISYEQPQTISPSSISTASSTNFNDTLAQPECEKGSIIDINNLLLGESIKIAGVPFSLNYMSAYAEGKIASNELEIKLLPEDVPEGLVSVQLKVVVAGNQFEKFFTPIENLSFIYNWNGKDAFGRKIEGPERADIEINYNFDRFRYRPSSDSIKFSRMIGRPTKKNLGFGGWSPSILHKYSGQSKTLFKGDGSERSSLKELGIRRKFKMDNPIINTASTSTSIFTSSPYVLARGNTRLQFDKEGYSYAPGAVDGIPKIIRYDQNEKIIDAFDKPVLHVNGKLPNGNIFFVTEGKFEESDCIFPPEIMYSGRDPYFSCKGFYLYEFNGESFVEVELSHFRDFFSKLPDTRIDGSNGYHAGYGRGGFHVLDIHFLPSMDFIVRLKSNINENSLNIWKPGEDLIFVKRGGRPRLLASSTHIAYMNFQIEMYEHFLGLGQIDYNTDQRLWGNRVFSPRDGIRTEQNAIEVFNPNGLIVDGTNYNFWDGQPSKQGFIASVEYRASYSTINGVIFEDYVLPVDIRQYYLNLVNQDESIKNSGIGTIPRDKYYLPNGDSYFRMEYLKEDLFINDIWLTKDGMSKLILSTTRGNLTHIDFSSKGYEGVYVGDLNFDENGSPIFIRTSGSGDGYHLLNISPDIARLGDNEYFLSNESGDEAYVFDFSGRHLRTVNPITGTLIFRFNYDLDGNLESVADTYERLTTFSRDAENRINTITSPDGMISNLYYDTHGNLASIINPNFETTSMEYFENGLLSKFIMPRGNWTAFTYDLSGRLQSEQQQSGEVVTFTKQKTDTGYETLVSRAPENSKNYEVVFKDGGFQDRIETNPDGSKVIETSSNGLGSNQSTKSYSNGTLLKSKTKGNSLFGPGFTILDEQTMILPSGLSSTYEENIIVESSDQNQAEVVKFTKEFILNEKSSSMIFDKLLGTVNLTSPANRTVEYSIDQNSKITQVSVPGISPVAYSYDNAGRVSTISQGDRGQAFTYGASGFLDIVSVAGIGDTFFTRDNVGRVTHVQTPDNKLTKYAYNENGNISSVTPDGRPAHFFSYNPFDSVDAYFPPEIGGQDLSTQYVWDGHNRLSQVIRPDGKTIVPVYHPDSGRITSIQAGPATVNLGYSSTSGQLTSILTSDSNQLDISYDGFLVDGISMSGDISGSVEYSYNNDFLINAISINGSDSISRTYDDDNLLMSVGDLLYSRNGDNGLLEGIGHGVVSNSLSYNEFGEIASDSLIVNGGGVNSFEYSRDTVGRIIEEKEATGGNVINKSYTYTDSGQLETVSINGVLSESYSYGSNGNRLNFGTDTAIYDDQDRLTSVGPTVFSYNENGDVESITGGGLTSQYVFDVFGNLRKVTRPDGTVIDYLIDGMNRRVGKKVNGALVKGWLYKDQLNPIAEVDSTGNILVRYVYGEKSHVPEYMVKNGVTYKIVTNHLGSPILVINSADGTIVQEIQYNTWGEIIFDSNPGFQSFGLAGGIYDSLSGLTRFGSRSYNPTTGRWMQKDPIGFRSGDTNLYRYVKNDPINKIDPFGLYEFDPHAGSTPSSASFTGFVASGGTAIAGVGGSLIGGGFISVGGNSSSDERGSFISGGVGAGIEFDAAITFGGVIGGSNNLQGEGYSIGGNIGPVGGNLLFNDNGSLIGGSISVGLGIGASAQRTETQCK